MKFEKKSITLGNVFSVLSILTSVVGIVIYVVNATGSYYHDFSMTVPIIATIAIALEIACMVLTKKKDELFWIDLFYPLAGIVVMIAAVVFIAARVESAGIILGSALEAGNAVAFNSLYQAFAGIGCFVVAMLFDGTSGFLKQR